MIKVNLGRGSETRRKSLPQKSKKKSDPLGFLSSVDKSDLGGVLLLVAAVALSLLPYLFLEQYKASVQQRHVSRKQELEEKRNSAEQELRKYESYKSELESFEKQKAQLTQRLDVLNQLLRLRSGPVNIIDAVGQGLPEAAWLDKINLSLGDNKSLNISGSAMSSEAITQFSEKLSASIYLSNVQLNEMVNGVDGKDAVKNFSFVATPKEN